MDYRISDFQIFPVILWGTGSDPPHPKHLPNAKKPVRAYSRCHAPFYIRFSHLPAHPRFGLIKKKFPLHSWVPRLPSKHSRLTLIYTSSFLNIRRFFQKELHFKGLEIKNSNLCCYSCRVPAILSASPSL